VISTPLKVHQRLKNIWANATFFPIKRMISPFLTRELANILCVLTTHLLFNIFIELQTKEKILYDYKKKLQKMTYDM